MDKYFCPIILPSISKDFGFLTPQQEKLEFSGRKMAPNDDD